MLDVEQKGPDAGRGKSTLITVETDHPSIYIVRDKENTEEIRKAVLHPDITVLAYPLMPLSELPFADFIGRLARETGTLKNGAWGLKHTGLVDTVAPLSAAEFVVTEAGKYFGDILSDEESSQELLDNHPALACYEFTNYLISTLLRYAGHSLEANPEIDLLVHNNAPMADLFPHTDLNKEFYENGSIDGPHRLRLLCGFGRARGTAFQTEDNLIRETLNPYLNALHTRSSDDPLTSEEVEQRAKALHGVHFKDPEFEWEVPVNWVSIHKIGRSPVDTFASVHNALLANLDQPGVLFHITTDLVEA